jgi:hypothetical protein
MNTLRLRIIPQSGKPDFPLYLRGHFGKALLPKEGVSEADG